MNLYELQVEINGEKQLIDTQMGDGVQANISLNYNIADIKDISAKNSSYSKTITLPNSVNNLTVFQYIFGINSDSTFDATKKSKCWVMRDTLVQFEGYLQLTAINYDRKNNIDTYTVVITADNDTLMKNIGEKLLTDLNLSYISHRYNNTNIVNSWTSDYSTGYVYPLIDYGYPFDITLLGRMKTKHLKPAIYYKTILDQIFIEAGYTYTSDFLNSSFFKKQIIPFNNKLLVIDPTLVPGITVSSTNVLFTANASSSQTANYSYGNVSWSSINANNESYDPNSYYSTTGHTYSVPADFPYAQRFRIDIDMLIDNGRGTSTGGPFNSIYEEIRIIIKRSKNPITGASVAGFTDVIPSTITGFSNLVSRAGAGWPVVPFSGADYVTIASGGDPGISVVDGITTTYVSGGTFRLTGTVYSDYLDESYDYNAPLQPGEQVAFFFMRYAQGAATSGIPAYTSSGNTIGAEINPSIIIENGYLDYANMLPANVKQKDLLGTTLKAFNLWMVPDKYNNNNFLIESRDDFLIKYKSIKDWSQKLDLNMPINSQITSNTQNVTNIFTYKADKDYYNEQYTDGNNRIFGDYKYEIDNDFINGEKKIELIFSPTIVDKLNNSTAIYLPIIKKADSGGFVSMDGMNIRVLYYNLLPLNAADTFVFNGNTYTNYPYAGNVDNPLTPTLSLNFGVVENFYTGYTETTNNLFYNFYMNMMLELSDKNSRIITAYFNLNPTDISQFSFGDLIFLTIDGQDGYYRINKIMNYDPSTNQTTKVELLKALDFDIPKTRSYRAEPGIILRAPTTGALSRMGNFSTSVSNNITTIGVMALGRNNNVSQPNNFISGDNHIITSSNNMVTGNNISLQGPNNIISGSSISVASSGNLVFGTSHSIVGNNNTIFGNNVVAEGTNLFIHGDNISISGSVSNSYAIGSNITLTSSNVFNSNVPTYYSAPVTFNAPIVNGNQYAQSYSGLTGIYINSGGGFPSYTVYSYSVPVGYITGTDSSVEIELTIQRLSTATAASLDFALGFINATFSNFGGPTAISGLTFSQGNYLHEINYIPVPPVYFGIYINKFKLKISRIGNNGCILYSNIDYPSYFASPTSSGIISSYCIYQSGITGPVFLTEMFNENAYKNIDIFIEGIANTYGTYSFSVIKSTTTIFNS